MIFTGAELAAMVGTVVAGAYALRGHKVASRANVRVAELQAETERQRLELERREAVHREASGIWADAAKWREEQSRIIEGLRMRVEGNLEVLPAGTPE